MPPSPAIVADGLTKRFDDDVAVDGLDLRVTAGSVYGFLGPNGAGKTTTIGMLTTLLRPSSGTARVAGHSIEDREAVAPHVGYLPETPPVYDELTGREQLEYLAALHDLPEALAAERIESLLDRFDLLDDADKRIGTYSKGMKQKTALVQAVLHEPSVLFLDEPTSGLDPRAARTVRTLVAELADGATTVFLSTHVLSVVEELADTIGVMYDGRLVAEGSLDELTHRAEGGERSLEEAFLEVTGGADDGAEDARSSGTGEEGAASEDGVSGRASEDDAGARTSADGEDGRTGANGESERTSVEGEGRPSDAEMEEEGRVIGDEGWIWASEDDARPGEDG